MTDRDEVRGVLRRLTEAWLTHPAEDIPARMEGLWHPDAVIVVVAAGAAEMARGAEACTRSYQDFVQQATVEDSRLSEPSVEVWGDTAVATGAWEMTYLLDGARATESGHETFVLVRTNGAWMIAWRAIMSRT